MTCEIITALIGVAGTLLGTILGWILNSLSQKGKLTFTESLWKNYVHQNRNGEMAPATVREEAQSYSYELALDVYNSSNETKIMRDVRMEFRKNGKSLFEDKPNDKTTRRAVGSLSHYDEIGPLNIPPKSILCLKLHGGIWNSDKRFQSLWDVTELVLLYKDERGRNRQAFQKRIDINSCLTQP